MKIPPLKHAVMEITAHTLKQFPEAGLPEIALAGRSNVGKSSLINSLTGQKGLARTSSAPGKTRSINFYRINDQWYLVDLPGYGYAHASKESRRAWNRLIESYINGRAPLKGMLHLVDMRHPPMESDHIMQTWVRSQGIRCCVIGTKSDKLSRSQRLQSAKLIKTALGLEHDVIAFSSRTGEGWEEVGMLLNEWING